MTFLKKRGGSGLYNKNKKGHEVWRGTCREESMRSWCGGEQDRNTLSASRRVGIHLNIKQNVKGLERRLGS